MNVNEELKRLGFSDNEVKVYLALLRIGSAKAGRIAKESFLERTSTYNAIKQLREKGMVSSVIESNRQVFSPAAPKKILDIFKENEERAKLIIPLLDTLQQFELEKQSILKFRGYNGIKTVMNDILTHVPVGGEYLLIGPEGQMSERMPTFTNIFVARKDKKRHRTRILVSENIGSEMLSEYTQARYLPQSVSSSVVTNIYMNKVAIILWSKIPEAIIIDNKEAAETYRQYFEFMWSRARKIIR